MPRFPATYHFLRHCLLACCLLLCCATRLWAKATVYDGRDGLNSNDISAIAKDKRGLMWIGTYSGLNIYDGYTFTRVDGPLAHLGITTLLVNDAREELMAGTENGLHLINLKSLRSYLMLPADKKNAAWSMQRTAALCTAAGTEYVAFGSSHIARINAKHELELVCQLPDTSRGIHQLVPYGDGLIVSNGDTWFVDLRHKTVSPFNQLKHKAPFSSVQRNGSYLVLNGYNSRLSLLHIPTLRDTLPALLYGTDKNIPGHTLYASMKGSKLYLFCDNYTFYIADLARNTLSNISLRYPDVFEGKNYNTLFVDEHDILWIATNKGLIKVEERPRLFSRELYNHPARVSTRSLLEDETGDLYVASYNGLWYRGKTGTDWEKIDGIPHESTGRTTARRSSLHPMCLLPDAASGALYLGFDDDLLLRMDTRTRSFQRLGGDGPLQGSQLRGIYSLCRDRNGRIWIGCGLGLAHYDPQHNRIVLHRDDAFDPGPVRVRYVYAAPGGDRLYVATVNGLMVTDLDGSQRTFYNTHTPVALSHNDVLFAEPDAEGNLWMGTNGGGINILAPDGKQIRYIHKQQGLSNEVVYSIIHEGTDIAWISTFNGLDRLRKSQRSFSNYFEEDGLSSNEFNQNSFLKTRDGKIYFGSINGITSFYPEQLSTEKPFTVFLSGISRWDDQKQSVRMLQQETAPGSTIIKRNADLLLELHFGCTDYADPQRNTFSYRIPELSASWISLEDRHTLNLSGIPYGSYTIEVKAINSRGATATNVLLFQVRVAQPFYRTWWFFALALLGLAMIFYTAYQIKYQSFKNILQLRMKIASNLHDEVGSLLTRITMFSDNLRYSRNTEAQRNTKLEKIAALSRNATTSMSDVLWTIDSRNDFAGNLLDRMREHTEEMLLPLGIDVNFVVQDTDPKQRMLSDTRGELYLIFKEAINNIAKHSEATSATIEYRVQDKYFLLKISNNRPKETGSGPSTGQGLHNMKMRAAKIGARIEVTATGEMFGITIRS